MTENVSMSHIPSDSYPTGQTAMSNPAVIASADEDLNNDVVTFEASQVKVSDL